MEVLLSPELEAKLNRLAGEQGRDRLALVQEAIERLVSHEEWFRAQVDEGIAAAEAGDLVDHAAIGQWLDQRFKP